MRVLVMCTVLHLVFSGATFAEVVTTSDGRRVDLRADGTYQVIEDSSVLAIPMTEQEPLLEHFAGKYGRNEMRFMPIFMNESEKAITGFRFRSVFKSAFGDEIFSFAGESSERILAGKSSTSAAFYYFEDNPFIANEPYDKLQIFETSGTGTVVTMVTAVVFEDGTIIKPNP